MKISMLFDKSIKKTIAEEGQKRSLGLEETLNLVNALILNKYSKFACGLDGTIRTLRHNDNILVSNYLGHGVDDPSLNIIGCSLEKASRMSVFLRLESAEILVEIKLFETGQKKPIVTSYLKFCSKTGKLKGHWGTGR